MEAFNKIMDRFVILISYVEAALISLIVAVMLYELILRNFLNQSFRASTELCGFLFMWMAFLGIIILYDKDRLITLDMLYSRLGKKLQDIFWVINKLFALGLGIVMVIAYVRMYPINKTSYFSTMQWLSKAWHFLPMAIAGFFVSIKTVYQLANKLRGGK